MLACRLLPTKRLGPFDLTLTPCNDGLLATFQGWRDPRPFPGDLDR